MLFDTARYSETILCVYRNTKILLGHCPNCKIQSFIVGNKLLCCNSITREVSFTKVVYLEEVNFNEEERITSLYEEVQDLRRRIPNKKKAKRILQTKMSLDSMGQKASKKLKEVTKILGPEEVLKRVKEFPKE